MNIQEIENNAQLIDFYFIGDQLKNHIYDRSRQAFLQGDKARDNISDIEQLEKRKKYIRETFLSSIGGLPETNCPLDAVTTGKISGDGFRIEKVVYQSRPGCYVTSNLYLPEHIPERCGAVLFLCGHSHEAKQSPVYQAVCQVLALSGLIVLIQDPLGQGERFSYYEKSLERPTVESTNCEHDYDGCRCLLIGDSIARYFVHDAIRSIDYLCSRPEVDPLKIGVTGSSGGGTQTCMVMMCEPRIAAAAPATFVMNRRTYLSTGNSQDSEQNWPGLSAAGIDHEDILISMSPKPVLILSAKYDFFPIEGTRESVGRTKRFWDLYGKGDNLRLYECKSVHKYTRELACAAAHFFSLHFNGRVEETDSGKIITHLPSELWCTKSGQIRAEYPCARGVFEDNRDRFRWMQDRKENMNEEDRREKAYEWLKKRIYTFREPCDMNCRFYGQKDYFGLNIRKCLWWSQKGMMNHAFLLTECTKTNQRYPVTIALWEGGTCNLRDHMHWIRNTCAAGRAVLILDVSGVGGAAPVPFNNMPPLGFSGVIFKLAYDLIWLGDSIAALRTYDTIRAVDMIEACDDLDKNNIMIYGCGSCGIYGLLASFLDKRIRRIDIPGNMQSYADVVNLRHYEPHDVMSVVIPGVLNYFDIPELKKWMKDRVCQF